VEVVDIKVVRYIIRKKMKSRIMRMMEKKEAATDRLSTESSRHVVWHSTQGFPRQHNKMMQGAFIM
jgi:hypothetical protein